MGQYVDYGLMETMRYHRRGNLLFKTTSEYDRKDNCLKMTTEHVGVIPFHFARIRAWFAALLLSVSFRLNPSTSRYYRAV